MHFGGSERVVSQDRRSLNTGCFKGGIDFIMMPTGVESVHAHLHIILILMTEVK